MKLEFPINPRRIAIVLGLISCFLVIVSFITEYIVEVPLANEPDSLLVLILNLFSVNLEQSIPTWFSVIILFFATVLIAIIAIAKLQTRSEYRIHWAALAIIFLYLSIDEGAAIHEIVANVTQTSLRLEGFFYFGWQIVAIPLVILLALSYLRFLFHLPSHIAFLFFLSASIFVGGALFVEGVSANQWYLDGGLTMLYVAIATIEELCEMLGVVVFIYALLLYIHESEIAVAFYTQSAKSLESNAEIGSVYEKPRKQSHLSQSLLKIQPSLLIIIFLIATNFAVFSWLVTQSQQKFNEAEPFYAPISDELIQDDVTILEMNSAFAVDDSDSLHFADSLFAQYETITIVSFPSSNQSVIFAGNILPFNRDSLTNLLHQHGDVEFIIFETPLLKALTDNL